MRACRPRSTLLQRVLFDEDNGILVVSLAGSRRYAYEAVPPAVYRELCNADSPGRFYNQNIKGRFVCRRVKV